MQGKIRDLLIQFVNEQCGGRRRVLAKKTGLSPDVVYRMLATGKMSRESAWRLQEALPLSFRNEFMQLYLRDFIAKKLRCDYAIYWLGQEIREVRDLANDSNLPRMSLRRVVDISMLPAAFPTRTRSAVRGMPGGRRLHLSRG